MARVYTEYTYQKHVYVTTPFTEFFIILINMPISLKFDSCKNFATNNLNVDNSLGLGSKRTARKTQITSGVCG